MALLSVPPWPDPGPSATAAATHHRARAVQLPRHGIYDCWGLQCFGCLVAASAPCRAMETPPLGPTLLYRCNNVLFFLTLRGNFGADSNNFGPCPSHAFRLSELQSLTDLLLYPVVFWANRGGFDSYKWVKSPALRPLFMARIPAPETTSCFAASVALLASPESVA